MKYTFKKLVMAPLFMCAMLLLGNQSNAQCTARYIWYANGSTVSFYDSSSSNTHLFYYWHFGDGSYSSAKNPSHTYQKTGSYNACLYIYDSTKTCFDSICQTVKVGNGGGASGCKASFSETIVGLQVYFKNSSNGASTTKYSWTFGDGNTSTQTHPSHTYGSAGTYTVCLIMTDSNCADTICKQYTLANATCKASFTNKSSGSVLTVTNTSTAGQGNVSYTWMWGDNSTSTGANPASHTYANKGTYTVCLFLYNSTTSCSDSICQSVTIGNSAGCQASFNASSTGGLGYGFTNTSNTLKSGTATYYWSYGDSTYDSTTNGSHTYSRNGSFYVCLKVVDGGCTNTHCQTISVGNNQSTCKAYFSETVVGLKIVFKNASNGSSATKYAWTFGDGNTSTQMHPAHTYTSAGTYTACLIMSDSGCSDTFCKQYTLSGANGYSIEGNVSCGNTAPTVTKVWLIIHDSATGTLTGFDSTMAKGGYYYFYTPHGGTFLIKAALDTADSLYNNYIPTYHGDNAHWDSATTVVVNTNKTGVNIHMIGGNNPGGPGFIHGYTSQGANKTDAVGDPVAGVEIILYDNAKKPVAYTYSDAQGKYGFDNLAYGTYEIYPEFLSKSAVPMQVTISAGKPSVSNVVVEINSKFVSVSLGVNSIKSGEANRMIKTIYPNPANSTLNIELEGNASLVTMVTDMQGRSTGLSASQEGNRIRLDVSSLASGMYILNLTSKDGSNYKQRFVKE